MRNQEEVTQDLALTPQGLNEEPQTVVESAPVVEPTRRSNRPRMQPRRYDDFVLNVSPEILLLESGEPESYKQAVTGPDSEKWLQAMHFEMDSMFENQVWT